MKFGKTSVIFEVCTLESAKFHANKKTFNSGPNILYLGLSGKNMKKLLPYLKSAPSNLSKRKFHSKQEKFKFWTKDALSGSFLD